eukprot:scaffold233_cov96-Amphora_coffeaeformis.AAC.2
MTSKTFRAVSLHNNERGNSRGLEGKKGARKSNSAKVASTKNACRFRLNIFWDKSGYYIQKGSGCTIHCKHMGRYPRDIPTSIHEGGTKFVHCLCLDDEQGKEVVSAISSCSQSGCRPGNQSRRSSSPDGIRPNITREIYLHLQNVALT